MFFGEKALKQDAFSLIYPMYSKIQLTEPPFRGKII